jgi:hypothetical protein
MIKEQFFQPSLRTYDISFDQNQAREIVDVEKFSSYLTMQMETHLGERFNVSLSRYDYDIQNGLLYGKDMDEPFIKSLKRGKDFRLTHGSFIDRKREEAEFVGFEKIQNLLTNPDTPIETMMLSISPQGGKESVYQHNFYDIFTLKDKDGKRFVEVRRYASSLSVEEFSEKTKAFTSIEIDDSDPGASFLEQPIAIQNTLTPDDLHSYLQKEHDFMDEKEFERIKKNCKMLIDTYTTSIVEQPDNDTLHKTLFNAILNKADDVATNNIEYLPAFPSLQDEVRSYAFAPVREVMTGCGSSGGYEVSQDKMNSPFTVASYAKDKYGERTFNCPSCKKENVRPFNTLLPRCLHCKSNKVSC